MKKFFLAAVLLGYTAMAGGAMAATIYVDAANQSGVEDGTLDNPYDTVVEALEATVPGDEVSVAPGVYYGQLNMPEGPITVVSQEGPSVTVLDGMNRTLIWAAVMPHQVDVVFDGFTMANAGTGAYVWTGWREPYAPIVTIKNSIMRDMSLGVRASIKSRVTLENVVLHNMVNHAFDSIWSYGSTLTNVTIDTTPVAIWAYQWNSPFLTNTSITNVGTVFWLRNNARVRGSNNNIWSYETYLVDEPNAGIVELTETISANPLFVNPPADYTLQPGSPLIDAGVDVGLPYVGAAPDIGAFEYGKVSLAEQVEGLATSFAEAPLDIYRTPGEQRQMATYNKLMAVINMISTLDRGNSAAVKTRALNGVLHKLEKDILAKVDGNNGGNPANDWIEDPQEKAEFYNHVLELITSVQEEIDTINEGN